ncbi:MAG: DUF1836 domain-containing protein [Acutalibacteraceae bacterium]
MQSGSRQPGEKTITKTIINNYSKARLLQKPVGKKYTPEHLLVITLIQTLKQSLSLEDVGRLPPVRSLRRGGTVRRGGSPCPV